MITFLITPVKSRRNSIYETPTCKLTFDVAETPVLFDPTLRAKQLQNLQSISFTSKKIQRKSNVPKKIDEQKTEQSTPTIDDSPSPIIKLFDNLLTPANIYSKTLNFQFSVSKNNKIDTEQDDDNKDTEQDDEMLLSFKNDIKIIGQAKNNKYRITMMISHKNLSQSKMHKYLIKNNLLSPKDTKNIIKPCDCVQCKIRNWNLINLKWEKQWQLQQFILSTNDKHKTYISSVKCDNITKIINHDGILQKELYQQIASSFYNKIGNGRKNNCYSNSLKIKKTKRRNEKIKPRKLSICSKNKAKDKKAILQHLSTWSDCYRPTSFNFVPEKQEKNDPFKKLPLVCKEDNGCSYISAQTLMDIMSNDNDTYSSLFDKYIVIDCRYKYEYLGGHIRNAISIEDKLLIQLLYKSNYKSSISGRICWIFHCEYSKHRGPETCKYFRKLDREFNEYRYPQISYPHVYVLHGGYKKFWNQYKNSYISIKHNIFEPYGYISMWNNIFDNKRYIHSQFRQNVWKKHKKKKPENCNFV